MDIVIVFSMEPSSDDSFIGTSTSSLLVFPSRVKSGSNYTGIRIYLCG